MYTFIKRYREYRPGDTITVGEVSADQLALFKKRGVIEQPDRGKSSDFTVAEVKAKVESMKIEEAFAFTKGDTRKTVQKLRDELVKTAR